MPLNTKTHSLSGFDESGQPTAIELVVIEGPDLGKRAVFTEGSVLVGTAGGAQFQLTDASVSRRHLFLHLKRASVGVEDLGSKNGTRYLESRVHTIDVRLGAQLTLGLTRLAVLPPSIARTEPTIRDGFGALVGNSLVMRRVFDELERAARSDASVMLIGETGSGKELAARAIHAASARSNEPFVVLDCAAVPESLWQSTLFGHARGAFTGASFDVIGVLEQANRGSLFLDHLTSLQMPLQASLLRALETQSFRRLGESKERQADFRVIAASQEEPELAVKEGRFRLDLSHRVAALSIELPSLRARRDDIAPLARALAAKHHVTLDSVKLAEWTARNWPGNVRELENAVQQQAHGAVVDDQQPVAPQGYVDAREQALRAFERHYLEQLLAEHGPTAAARVAGLARSHFYRLLDAHGLTRKR